MKRRARLTAILLAASALVSVSPALSSEVPASAAAPLVRSSGSVPNLPPGSRAVGALPGPTLISADVALSPRDPGALNAFANAVSTPGSPSFRKYLTPGSFEAAFGPSPSTISAVRAWLAQGGLRVGPTTSDGLIVPVEGSAATLEKAFGIGFEQYQLPSGRVARMPTGEPLVPAALAGSLTGVVGLDNLARPAPEIVRENSAGSARFGSPSPSPTPRSQPLASRASAGPQANCQALASAGLSATQLAQAYSFTALYGAGNEGQGTTIGIYELEPYLPSDIATYEACYSPAITAP